MNFEQSIEALKSWSKTKSETALPLFKALCADLSPGAEVPEVAPIAYEPDDYLFRPLSHLSWWGGDSRARFTDFTGTLRTGELLDTDYDVVWLDIALGPSVAAGRVPEPTLRAFHEQCVRTLGGEDPMRVSRLRDALVLFVTVHGKSLVVPDLYVAGPARNETGTDYLIGVLPLHLSKAVKGASGDVGAVSAYLAPLQGLARGAGPGKWRTLFGSTGEVRDVFRKAMAERLATIMHLIEETVGRRADDLLPLREAGTLLVFRLMFLMELEGRRGLLYLPGKRPASRLSLFELADTETARQRKDSMLARLQELTEHIRKGTGGVALSGASIFSNQPNDDFEPEVTEWLDSFDSKVKKATAEIKEAWNSALALAGALVTGQVEVYSKDAPIASAVGLGGSEHVQRVLGDVYEQILAMVPKRERGKIVLTAGKGGEKNERSALSAHYTPEGMVVEVVRPLVAMLFRDAWSQCGDEPLEYRRRLLDLHIVDPAMGSAHFLTVVALEIAKELAWVDRFSAPQPEAHFELLTNRDPWNAVTSADSEDLQRRVRQYLPTVVRQCCHGVDVKPLACELGKLALWLFTMTAEPEERPSLTFVDGNVRTGDSLTGVTWKEAVEIISQRLDWDPSKSAQLFSSSLNDLRRSLDELSLKMRTSSGPTLREWLLSLGEDTQQLPDDDHMLRQHALRRLRSSMDEIRWAYDLAVLAIWYPTEDSLLEALRSVASNPNSLPRSQDADRVSWGSLMMGEGRGVYGAKARDVARAAVRALAKRHRVFHWELEFPDVMDGRRFDGIVANPPFRGDRDLKEAIGEECKEYLKARYTDGVVLDLTSFFFLRYDQLIGDRGALGSLATNTLAQGKNRRLGLKPLLTAPRNGWIFRAVRNRLWPGEAAVFICMVHIARPTLARSDRLVVTAVYDESGAAVAESVERVSGTDISSYLDAFAETDLRPLVSMSESLAFQGMQHMGPFECEVDFLRTVPKRERHALRAYLDNKDVQSQPQPVAPRLVIDVHDALEEAQLLDAEPAKQLRWLKANLPTLVAEMERKRAAGEKSSNSEAWWKFHRTRQELRDAWKGLTRALFIGRHVKVFSPASVPLVDPVHELRVLPSDALVIVVAESLAFAAVLSSFVCELHVRRECSTIKTDLRVTPTEAFPSLPLPWPAQWSAVHGRPRPIPAPASLEQGLGKRVAAILELRRNLLTKPQAHGIPASSSPRGPTDLYDLFDNPNVTFEGIARLRESHRELSADVVHAYGWGSDGPDGAALKLEWGFERPWIDGTTRYVPSLAARRELIVRLARRNRDRYEEEMRLCVANLAPLLPAKGLTESGIDKWRKVNGISLSEAEIVEAMGFGVQLGSVVAAARNGRVTWSQSAIAGSVVTPPTQQRRSRR